MSELPQTDELPRAENGYDAARVEEAFASFAERVHELESVAGELRAELRELRSQRPERRRLDSPRYENEEWPAEGGLTQSGLGPSPDWVASVPAPLIRPLAVPRLALEAIFLVLVALFAGLADLSTTSIVILMAAAWALVVLSEWAAVAKRARWRLESVAAPVESRGEGASDSTGPWSMPVVQATVVEAPDDSESHTVVTTLPPEPEAQPEAAEPEAAEAVVAETEVAEPEDAETEDAESEPPIPTVEAEGEPAIPPAETEPAAKRRRWSLRRGRGADESTSETPDPWEI